MSTQGLAGARPAQVTVAAGVAAAGSALLVLTLYEAMTGLSSVAMRQEIARVLAESGHPWGLTVSGAVQVLHDLMLFAGATAAAATVLAVYTLFRHRGARIGLTIAAALLLVTVVSGVMGILVAAATAMLWSRPARDWFAGRTPAPAPAAAASDGQQAEPLLSSADDGSGHPPEHQPGPEEGPTAGEPAPDEQPHAAPPPTYGFGTPHAHQGPSYPGAPAYPASEQGEGYPGYQQPTYPPRGGWPPPAYGQAPARGPRGNRPVTVTIAAVLTWLFAGIATAGYVAVIALLLADRTQLVDRLTSDPRFRDMNVTGNQLVAAVWVMSAIVILWAVIAMVLAFLAFRGHNWARITLVVSAAVTLVLGVAVYPLGLAHAIVAAAVILLLFTGGANGWFTGRGRPGYPSYGPPPPSYGPPPQQYGPPQYGPPQDQPQQEQKPPRNVW